MAYTSGTAANYKDLLAILATFAAANGWTILEQSETAVYLRGEGLAGLDEIYCGVSAIENTSAGYFNWSLRGAIGYRAGRGYATMPMANSQGVYITLWNAAIPYWMVANGRRIMVFAKVGTVYTCCHIGLIDPLGTANQYPYPLLVGGMAGVSTRKYSDMLSHSAFWEGVSTAANCGVIWGMDGRQSTMQRSVTADTRNYGGQAKTISAYSYFDSNLLQAPDGSYLVTPFYVVDHYASQIYGQINGLFRVSGQNNAAENIITVDGVNYMVFPNAYRSGRGDYCCMRMN